MMIHGITSTLWLFLLLPTSGSESLILSLIKSEAQPQEGYVRLVGSATVSEGRVEIFHNGTWGTVCDDGWDLNEAQVVCRQLQYPGAKSAVIGGVYGEGSGPIWLDDIDCKGTEKFLFNCSFKAWALTDCTHKEDVGVVCETGMNVSISSTRHLLDHSLGLSEELGQLFDSGNGCDFFILVQSPTGNRQENGTLEMFETTVCAHKVILSQFPHFSASHGISNISVRVSQSCQPHFNTFIRYIYTRKMDVTISSAQCLHQMASEFGVTQLMQDTGRLFTRLLPEDSTFHTQVSLYEYAVEARDLVLQESCLQYLAWNYHNLTMSPAWYHLSTHLLEGLLSRSDLVVPNEAFLLISLENWITEKGDSISLERQADLLGHIRFPMIPAEKLYGLQFTSSLYKAHQNLYQNNMLKGFQFNVLLFSTLKNHSGFMEDDDYLSRIYTAEPWSAAIDSRSVRETPSPNCHRSPSPPPTPIRRYHNRYNGYGNYPHYVTVRPQRYVPTTAPPPYLNTRTQSFSTPAHNSLMFKDQMINWEANLFMSQCECSYKGYTCESFPAAKLSAQNSLSKYQTNLRFSNRLLLMCQGKYICQVQDFKNDLAHISTTGSQVLPYPCPNNEYIYRFVVRPEYI